jgi:hypothetical protein
MTLPVEVVKKRGRPSGDYSPSEITLYGVRLVSLDAWVGKAFQSAVAPIKVNILAQPAPATVAPAGSEILYVSALIYAYAYQGHCYNLPEPVILIVEDTEETAVGYDFDGSGYKMWKVQKLDRTLQLEPTSDTFEEIILKRGLTGAKQPISYHVHAQISHRGGKLTE